MVYVRSCISCLCKRILFLFTQIFRDDQSLATSCDLHSLQEILDPREASNQQMNVSTYRHEISELFSPKTNDRLTVVALDKATNTPCGIATFKKSAYDPSLIQALPSLQIHDSVLNINRKTLWELSYCIRRADKKGKCLGDICISSGLEAVRNKMLNERRQSTSYVWLLLAGNNILLLLVFDRRWLYRI